MDTPSLIRQEEAITRDSWGNAALALLGGALAVAGLLLVSMVGGAAGIIGGIAAMAAGGGIFYHTQKKETEIINDYVDVKARQTTHALASSLADKGVALTPAQLAAVRQAEHARLKSEWTKKLEKERQAADDLADMMPEP